MPNITEFKLSTDTIRIGCEMLEVAAITMTQLKQQACVKDTNGKCTVHPTHKGVCLVDRWTRLEAL